MIEAEWLSLPNRFPNIRLYEFVVMPDHFHGILEITVGAALVAQKDQIPEEEAAQKDPVSGEEAAQKDPVSGEEASQKDPVSGEEAAEEDQVSGKQDLSRKGGYPRGYPNRRGYPNGRGYSNRGEYPSGREYHNAE
jgi:hypothetical protein